MELWEEDLYELLGVESNVGTEEIKKAYKKLAIEFHPDRFPDDDEKRKEGSARFSKITNAYNILKDEEERAEYDFARRLGYGTATGNGAAPAKGAPAKEQEAGQSVNDLKKSQAQNQFEQGKVYHKSKNWQKAISCYQEATRLNPSVADYHAHLGLAYIQQGLKTPGNNALAAAYKLDRKNRIVVEYYLPPNPEKGGKGKAKGGKGKSGTGLLDQLKSLFAPKNPKGKKAVSPPGKKTAPLKKAGAKK